jgi:hypothetical protein
MQPSGRAREESGMNIEHLPFLSSKQSCLLFGRKKRRKS